MHKVFVYGILKTEDHRLDPPAAVRGTLYQRGIALARFDETRSDTEGVVRGQIREISDVMLECWDGIEGVNHEHPERGHYRRLRVWTTDGIEAWAYQYNGNVSGCAVIADGIWRGNL